MSRKISKRKMLVIELCSNRRVRREMAEKRPGWFRQHDFDRLDREFAAKSAQLVALEIAAFERRIGRGGDAKTNS